MLRQANRLELFMELIGIRQIGHKTIGSLADRLARVPGRIFFLVSIHMLLQAC